jgi:hypothetical protein
MELLPDELRKSLPALYAQQNTINPQIYAKFFTPDSDWTWFVAEGETEGEDFIFFGYVVGFEPEWGYFSLNELQAVRGLLNLPVERDLHFTPGSFDEVIAQFKSGRGEEVIQ